MAIKEFVIGPQNYFEGDYFAGDYTLSNVSKAYLQCDIDNIKGGRVVTGEYFQDNYIDGTYWHANQIKAELVAEGMIVQEVSWNYNGTSLAVVISGTSPYVLIYNRSGDTFTTVADPATLPVGSGRGVSFGINP